MHKHQKERITLKKASEIANLSSNYFSALFKKEVGINFSQYSRLIRIKKAMKLLRKTSFSNKEISYEFGFRHVSGFCREFKRVTGITPSVYRKRYRLFRPIQTIIDGILRIVNAIGKNDSAIVRINNKIQRIDKKNQFTNSKKNPNF